MLFPWLLPSTCWDRLQPPRETELENGWYYLELYEGLYESFIEYKDHLPFLVSTTEPGQNHLSEAAGPVQFGLTFGPLDGALQPPIKKTLKIHRGKKKIKN